MKKMISLMLAVLTASAMLAIPANGAGEPTFSDVPTTHWAYSAIEKMADKGIVTGVGNGRFDPDATVTTAQFAAMMTRTFFSNELEDSHPEASEDWYGQNMHVALEHELLYAIPVYYTHDIVNGREVWNSADANAPLERAFMATMMYNYLSDHVKLPVYLDLSGKSLLDIVNTIPDRDRIDHLYNIHITEMIAAVYNTGCLAGVDAAGTFDPDANMTRAQACVVLDRMINYVAANKYTGTQPSYVQNLDDIYVRRPMLANGKGASDRNMYERIMELQAVYPQGYPCDDKNFIRGMYDDVTGCAAFAAEVMLYLYGTGNEDMYYDVRYVGDVQYLYGDDAARWTIDKIRVGDVLRLANSHSVVVIGVDADSVTVVEGNYHGIVNWGRVISKDTLLKTYDLQIQTFIPIS